MNATLTLRQPWAWLVIAGHKSIENRSWGPPASLIGHRMQIHAGLAVDPDGLALAARLGVDLPRELVRGAIIGSVRVDAVVDSSDSPWWRGPLGWVLSDPQACPPRYFRGRLGLWRAA